MADLKSVMACWASVRRRSLAGEGMLMKGELRGLRWTERSAMVP